jgi:hypothetical protein
MHRVAGFGGVGSDGGGSSGSGNGRRGKPRFSFCYVKNIRWGRR